MTQAVPHTQKLPRRLQAAQYRSSYLPTAPTWSSGTVPASTHQRQSPRRSWRRRHSASPNHRSAPILATPSPWCGGGAVAGLPKRLIHCFARVGFNVSVHVLSRTGMKVGLARGIYPYLKCRVRIFIVITSVGMAVPIMSARARARSGARARVRGVHIIVHAAYVVVSRGNLCEEHRSQSARYSHPNSSKHTRHSPLLTHRGTASTRASDAQHRTLSFLVFHQLNP